MAPQDLTLDAAIEAFVLSRQIRGCTEATIRNLRNDLGRFRVFVEKDQANVLLRDLTLMDCQRYLTALRSSMNQTSLHHYATGLHVFFRWAVACELIPKNPMQSIKTICPYTLPKAPPPERVEQLLRACGSDWFSPYPHVPIAPTDDVSTASADACGPHTRRRSVANQPTERSQRPAPPSGRNMSGQERHSDAANTLAHNSVAEDTKEGVVWKSGGR